ncbi:MAG: ArsR/SmtB family transcription factor [Aestuariivirgaceae bacterium]
MEQVLAGLRAAGESTRLRLLFVLSHGEFNVTELTQILLQSQPRISRHLKLMTDAGLLERYKEGSWVVFRLREGGDVGRLAQMISGLLDKDDSVLRGDLKRLGDVVQERAQQAADYFSRNAANWDAIRNLHVSEAAVERAILELAGDEKRELLLDLGTGTGRVLELLAGKAEQAVGIDLSRDMLSMARANLAAAGLKNAQVRHGDIFSLPFDDGAADLVVVHQVLHYLDDPARVLAEAARVLSSDGSLLISDFAPHELEFLRDDHAHRRLGIADADMNRWLAKAGVRVVRQEKLAPPGNGGKDGLTVSLWLACR